LGLQPAVSQGCAKTAGQARIAPMHLTGDARMLEKRKQVQGLPGEFELIYQTL
jgi:hypothetical protein